MHRRKICILCFISWIFIGHRGVLAQWIEKFESHDGQTIGYFQYLRRNCWSIRGISYDHINGLEGSSLRTGVLRNLKERSITTGNVFVKRGDTLKFFFRLNKALSNQANAYALIMFINYEGGVLHRDSLPINNTHLEWSEYVGVAKNTLGFARIRIIFKGRNASTVNIDNLYYSGKYLQCQNCLPIVEPTVQNVSRCGTGPVFIPAPGGNLSEYIWYDANMNRIPNQNGAGLLVQNLTSTQTFHVSIKRNACQSPPARVKAVVIPQPATPTVLGASICSPGSMTLQAFGGEEGNYRWFNTLELSSIIPGAVNSTFTTPFLDSTKTYWVAIANGQCLSWRRAVTATVTNFNAYYEVEQVNPSLFRYRAYPIGASYQWYTGFDSIPGAIWQQFTTSLPNIVVRVRVNNCDKYYPHFPGGRFAANNDPDNLELNNFNLSIFPNPASKNVNIQIQAASEGKAHLQIFDCLGRQLFDQQNLIQEGNTTISLDISHLQPGMYHSWVTVNGVRKIQKLWIQ